MRGRRQHGAQPPTRGAGTPARRGQHASAPRSPRDREPHHVLRPTDCRIRSFCKVSIHSHRYVANIFNRHVTGSLGRLRAVFNDRKVLTHDTTHSAHRSRRPADDHRHGLEPSRCSPERRQQFRASPAGQHRARQPRRRWNAEQHLCSGCVEQDHSRQHPGNPRCRWRIAGRRQVATRLRARRIARRECHARRHRWLGRTGHKPCAEPQALISQVRFTGPARG